MARFYARNFQCTDEKCGKKLLNKFKWDDDLTQVTCECGQEMMELFKGEVEVTGYLKFNSLSNEDKSKMLKKRSHEHFEREIKEKKHEMLKDMKKGFFNK